MLRCPWEALFYLEYSICGRLVRWNCPLITIKSNIAFLLLLKMWHHIFFSTICSGITLLSSLSSFQIFSFSRNLGFYQYIFPLHEHSLHLWFTRTIQQHPVLFLLHQSSFLSIFHKLFILILCSQCLTERERRANDCIAKVIRFHSVINYLHFYDYFVVVGFWLIIQIYYSAHTFTWCNFHIVYLHNRLSWSF